MGRNRFGEITQTSFYSKAESTVSKPFLKDMSIIEGNLYAAYVLHSVKSHDPQQGCLDMG